MMILEKLEEKKNLSPNERIVADYLLNYEGNILQLTALDISHKTFTSSSTTIRLAKKLGFNGWISLRESIYVEKNI